MSRCSRLAPHLSSSSTMWMWPSLDADIRAVQLSLKKIQNGTFQNKKQHSKVWNTLTWIYIPNDCPNWHDVSHAKLLWNNMEAVFKTLPVCIRTATYVRTITCLRQDCHQPESGFSPAWIRTATCLCQDCHLPASRLSPACVRNNGTENSVTGAGRGSSLDFSSHAVCRKKGSWPP